MGYYVGLSNGHENDASNTIVDKTGRFSIIGFGHKITLRYARVTKAGLLDFEDILEYEIWNVEGNITDLVISMGYPPRERTILIGGLSAALIIVGGIVSLWRKRRKGEAKVVAEQREKILRLIVGSDDVVVLWDLATVLDVSEDSVRGILEEAVGGGLLAGLFSNDGRTFITDVEFKRILKDKLKSE